MPVAPIDSFLICKIPGSTNAIRRLVMTDQAQSRLEAMLSEQEPAFTGPEIVRVPFDPTYKTDEESVLEIKNFDLPEHIVEALANRNEVPIFEANQNVDTTVKAAFHVGANGTIYFQCWRNVDAFGRQRIWLLLTGDTFQVEDKTPLVLERRIDAIFLPGDLLFKSMANTSTMLELINYVAEATADDINSFATNPLFTAEDDLLDRCSKSQRKYVRLLIQTDILKGQTVDSLLLKAAEVGYSMEVSDGKIVIPGGGTALSDLLSFLNERIFKGILSGTSMLANSARKRD